MKEMDNLTEVAKRAVAAIVKQTEKDKEKSNLLTKNAVVIAYDNDTYKTTLRFVDDHVSNNEYILYNKSGEVLSENDNVRVYYTSNPAKGWVGMRLGEPDIHISADGIEPITAISVNSDVDYTISTNAGTERYIAAFEDA